MSCPFLTAPLLNAACGGWGGSHNSFMQVQGYQQLTPAGAVFLETRSQVLHGSARTSPTLLQVKSESGLPLRKAKLWHKKSAPLLFSALQPALLTTRQRPRSLSQLQVINSFSA